MRKKTKTIKLPVQTQTQTTRMKMKKKIDGSYEFADVRYSRWKTDRTYTTSESGENKSRNRNRSGSERKPNISGPIRTSKQPKNES